ncbi:MAG TPA: cytochrome c oxidase assembly protein [Gemmatimonadales bacterium]|nr:cytochrome c oxidase assembly protein [Gemmatimonadales bacterium]
MVALVTGWQWHPLLGATLLASGLGHAAVWWRWPERPRPLVPLMAWWGGLLAVAIAACSRLDPLSDARLSAHMVQHEVLTFAAAPLLVVGMRPVTLALLPRLGSPVARWGHALTRPRVTWVLAAVTLWVWHWPAFYDCALAHPVVHDVEHATLLTAYALYWSPFVAFGYAVAALRTDAARTLYLATGGTQSGLLGALLAFKGTAVYPHYVGVIASGELALRDQQLAGLIMLVSGAAVFVAAAPLTLRGK